MSARATTGGGGPTRDGGQRTPSGRRSLLRWPSVGVLALAAALIPACKKAGTATGTTSDGGAAEAGVPACGSLDGGYDGAPGSLGASDASRASDDGAAGPYGSADGAGGAVAAVDELGPNAVASKSAASLGRVNIYEVTSPRWLEELQIYLRAGLPETRLTLAVHEATSRDSPFHKLFDVQLDFGTCEGWTSSGPLAIPLEPGRFYAVGFDPNQPVTPFLVTDSDTLPIDGAFGRLVASKTSKSVSTDTLTWDLSTDKEYNRQRLVTSPRKATPAGLDAGTGGDASQADGGNKG
jgi:hypothetical protein